MKELIKYITAFFKLIKLETMTIAGRVNLSSVVALIAFIIAYTKNDMLCYLISAVRDAVKTIALKQDISAPYQTVNVFKLIIPVLLLMIFCLLYLYVDERKKRRIDS